MNWFLNTNEKVDGPYSSEAIKTLIDQGQVSADSLIWGRGQNEWILINQWLQALTQTTETDHAEPFAQTWHYAVNGDSKGPFTRAELLHELRNIREKDQILIWTKGMKAWADLFDFHDLVAELDMDRREDPRADINGFVLVKNEGGRLVQAQLKTISVGGCGAQGLEGLLQIGNSVTLEIKSSELPTPIVTSAQVQYVTELGFVGFRFDGLNMESKSLIQQYIREQSAVSNPAAA